MFAGPGLGQDGPLSAEWEGILGGPPGSAGDGQLSAYKDGSLGRLRGAGGCVGCGMGEYFSGQRGVGEYFSGKSGVGEYFSGTRGMGEYFKPARGMGEYFSGTRGVRGLGQSDGIAVDLRKASVLRELKMAMYAVYAAAALPAADQYGEAWLSSGTWDSATTQMWFQVAQMLATEGQVGSELFIATGDTGAGDTAMYPTPAGVQALMVRVGFQFFTSPDSPPMAATYPVLSMAAVTQPSSVTAPFFSTQAKMRASVMKYGLYGLGVATVAAIVVAVRKKR